MTNTTTRQALVAEFFGTAVLLIAIVGSGLASDSAGSEAAQLFQHSLIIGLALVGLVSAFAGTSGAHFNPAVTVADALLGNRSWRTVPAYLGAQLSGAVVGVVLTNVLFDLDPVTIATKNRAGLALASSELVATIILVAIIFATVRTEHVKNIALVVGAIVGALIFATPSTAMMNPAVTVSRALTDTWTGIRPVDVLPFVAAQFVGAWLAVWVVRSTE